MKNFRVVLNRLLTLCIVLALLPGTAWAAETLGTCGDNLTWSYSDGTLTIQGTGRMDDYSEYNSPWYNYGGQMHTVSISDGVTSIGKYAFFECTSLTSVDIPDSVTGPAEKVV